MGADTEGEKDKCGRRMADPTSGRPRGTIPHSFEVSWVPEAWWKGASGETKEHL